MRFIIFALLGLACSNPETNSKDSADTHDHSGHGDTDLPDDFDDTPEKLSVDGLAWVAYTTEDGTLPESTEFSVLITVGDPTDSSSALDDATVTAVDATMPAHGGHGMNVTPVVTDNGDGTFTAAPIKLHMPGHWILHVDVEVGGAQDTANFDIDCCD